VAGSCECGDQRSGSSVTELVSCKYQCEGHAIYISKRREKFPQRLGPTVLTVKGTRHNGFS
jgi:hypothetical protein